MKKYGFKNWLIIVLASWLGTFIIRILGITLIKKFYHKGIFDNSRKDGAIFAFWHNNSTLVSYLNRNAGVHSMVSSSKDGEIITRITRAFGNDTVRGSTTRGGIGALKTMLRMLQQKKSVGFTPDGPKGPLYQIQDGIIAAAMKSQKPIIPWHYQATREWVFEKSWDKHYIPKPFSIVVSSFGEPVYLPKTENPDAEYYKKARKIVYEAMMKNTRFCQEECKRLKK